MGAAFAVPLAVWWSAQDLHWVPGSEAPVASPLLLGVRGLWIAQAAAIPLLSADARGDRPVAEALAEPLAALFVAVPLSVIPWLAGLLPLSRLLAVTAVLAAYVGAVALGARWLVRRIPSPSWREPIGSASLLLLAALTWGQRAQWLGCLGL